MVLRAPRSRDFNEWRQLRRQSRDFLKPYEPRWTEADLNREAFGARLWRGRQEAALRGTDYSFLLFEKRGRTEVWWAASPFPMSAAALPSSALSAIGWAEQFAGRGLMSEAVGVLLPFFFDTLGLHRLQAAFLPHNVASRRVLEKTDFGKRATPRATSRSTENGPTTCFSP